MRYSDDYDAQDAAQDAFLDSCIPVFCLNTDEMSLAHITEDGEFCNCCNDDNYVSKEEILFYVEDTKYHIARKDHSDNIKKGDKYRKDYIRIVYEQEGVKEAFAKTWKNLVRKA